MNQLTPVAEAVKGALHARLGPSNKRWPMCAGSPREEERYGDVAGAPAIDGTGSHLLLELCMKNNVSAVQYDQQIIGVNHPDNMNGWLIAPDRIERVQMALDYIARRVAELKEMFPGCTVTVESEQKVDPGGAFGRSDWWGTCDITIIARESMTGDVHFIESADYKDGRGYVSEKDNSQLNSYLFGRMRQYIAKSKDIALFNHLNISGCRVTIIQPKTNPVIRYQCSTRPEDGFDVKSVIEAAKKLSVAAHLTDDPDAPLVPGDHCQWCKANPKRGGHCTAKTDQSLQTVGIMEKDDNNLIEYISKAVADPKSIPVEMLSELADAEEGFQAAFDRVKAEIVERIEQGIKVPGYAMVPGKGSNIWNEDEETIVKKLKGRRLKNIDIYPQKLISPAAVLKLTSLNKGQKARIEKDLISFKGGKLTLKKVAHDHKDEKEVSESEMMFADVPKQTEEVSFF